MITVKIIKDADYVPFQYQAGCRTVECQPSGFKYNIYRYNDAVKKIGVVREGARLVLFKGDELEPTFTIDWDDPQYDDCEALIPLIKLWWG